jgi:hypothetical protein
MKDMLDDIPDDQLRSRLQNFKEEPDERVWQNLQGSMKNESTSLTDRLQRYHEEPDEAAWKNISAGVRLQRLSVRFENIAAVISVVALVLLLYPAVNNDREHQKATAHDEISAEAVDLLAQNRRKAKDENLSSIDTRRDGDNNTTDADKEIKVDDENNEKILPADLKNGSIVTPVEKLNQKATKDNSSTIVKQENLQQVLKPNREVRENLRLLRSRTSSIDTTKLDLNSHSIVQQDKQNEQALNANEKAAENLILVQSATSEIDTTESSVNSNPIVHQNEPVQQVLNANQQGRAVKNSIVSDSASAVDPAEFTVNRITSIEIDEALTTVSPNEISVNNSLNPALQPNDPSIALLDSTNGKSKKAEVSNTTVGIKPEELPSVMFTTKTDSLKQLTKLAKTNVASPLKGKKQNDKKRTTRNNGLYALLMPTLGYQQIKPLEDDDIFIQSVERLSAFSPKRLGIRGEAGYDRSIGSKWGMHIGVLYYQRKQTISYYYNQSSEVEVVKLPGDTLAYAVEPTTLFSSYEYQVKNLGVLLGINYNIEGNRFTQKIGVSGELHKPVSANGDAMYLFANVYYRIAHKLSDRFDLMIQPTFNYALQVDSRVTAPFYVKPYGLGLNFGVYYHLNTGK